MELNIELIIKWSIPVGIIALSFFLGLFFEWIIIKTIVRLARKTKAKWDDVIVDGLKKAFVFWFLLIGVAIAKDYIPYLNEEGQLYILKVVSAIASFLGVWVLAKIIHGLIKLGMSSFKDSQGLTSSLLPNAARALILGVGLVFILNDFIEMAPVLGALGIGGLAAALAFKNPMENLFSGFQLLLARKVRAGDYINLDSGQTGFVTDINWRETTVRDFNNNLVIIPNSQVSNSIVTNYNLPINDIYMELVCGVAYGSDLQKVEDLVKELGKEVYKEVMGEELEGDPTFFYLDFGESSIDFKTKILVKQFGDRVPLKTAMIKAIHRRFNEEGIDIPFPIRTIYQGS
jgi:small-conductance mechanosensitive channel